MTMISKSLACIDGDILIYKISHACQKTSVLVYGIEENGHKYLGAWKNRTEAIKETGREKDGLEFTDVVKPEPVQSVEHTTRAMLKRIVEGSGCEDYMLFIDGPGNFRNHIPSTLPYKGQRSSPKPVYFNYVKGLLLDEHPHRIICNMEADDALSIMQYKGFKEGKKYVACTIDKDAKNTPGWLYNWDKMEAPEHISEIDAMRSFYKQVLTGDKSDNYEGCKGIGDKSSLLPEIDSMEDEKEMYEFVLQQYIKAEEVASQHREVGKGKWKDRTPIEPEEDLLSNARLAWMLREKPEFNEDGTMKEEYLWTPPK